VQQAIRQQAIRQQAIRQQAIRQQAIRQQAIQPAIDNHQQIIRQPKRRLKC
jgi:hypothetical protein